MTPDDELRHLRVGPAAGELPDGAGLVGYHVRAADTAAVARRAIDVLAVVLEQGQPWPDLDRWRRVLPGWFVDGCVRERTEQETHAWLSWWRTLGPAARATAGAERAWALSDWLYWLEPDERQWFWWDSRQSSDCVEVLVVVDGWPYPDGSLRWLLRVAGATSVHSSG